MRRQAIAFATALLVVSLGCGIIAVAAICLGLPDWVSTAAGVIWGALTGPEVYNRCNR